MHLRAIVPVNQTSIANHVFSYHKRLYLQVYHVCDSHHSPMCLSECHTNSKYLRFLWAKHIRISCYLFTITVKHVIASLYTHYCLYSLSWRPTYLIFLMSTMTSIWQTTAWNIHICPCKYATDSNIMCNRYNLMDNSSYILISELMAEEELESSKSIKIWVQSHLANSWLL